MFSLDNFLSMCKLINIILVFLFTVSRGVLSLSVKGMSKVGITKLLWFCITSLCFIFEPIRGETKTTCSLLSLHSKFFIMSSFAGNKLMWKYLICRLCLARKWVESCLVHSIPCASCDMPEKLFCNSTYTTFYAEMSRQCEKNSRYMTAEFVFILKFVCSWLYLRLACRTWHRYLKGRKFLHVTH